MGTPVDLVVPVKELRHAKTRLAPVVAALDPARRTVAHRALAAALVRDTLAAVADAGLRRIIVVTTDPAELSAVAPPGVVIITDPGGGLNAAVRHGVRYLRADGSTLVAALHADLPALRPAELDDALDRARDALGGAAPAAFVPDHVGTGTTLLVGAPGAPLDPRFGPGSAAAHRAAGAVELDGPWPGLRTDVDTAADLALVSALGTGAATRGWQRGRPTSPVPAAVRPGDRNEPATP